MCLTPASVLVRLLNEKPEPSFKMIVFAFLACVQGTLAIGFGLGIRPTLQAIGFYFVGVVFLMIPALQYHLFLGLRKHDKFPQQSTFMRFITLRDYEWAPKWGVWVTMFLCLIVVTVGVGRFLYPSVYAGFGGGRPQTAKLILNHEGVVTWSKLPWGADYDALAKKYSGIVVSNPEPVLTDEVEILYENENLFVIRWKPRDSHAIVQLDRKLVLAVIPLK